MRVRVRFAGRVQGVGFRASTREIARGARVSGWVRNEPDGSVLAEFQGTSEAVERVLAGIRSDFSRFLRGEDSAAIADVDGEEGFEIRR